MSNKKVRKLSDGKTVVVHRNDGIRKRCGCARRDWSSCPHPWHFSFKWRDTHHRFPIDRYAERVITTRDEARDEADRLRRLIRTGQFPPASPVAMSPAQPSELTFETFAEKWFANARINESKHQQVNERGYVRRLARLDLGNGRLLGSSPIGLLTIDDWERAFGQLKGAASTLNKIRQAILSMQEWAAEKGYLPRPWLAGKVLKKGGLIARKKGARRDRRLAPDVLDENGRVKLAGEERRLMEKASPWLQRLIIAALETGCRRGELLSLTWADVSLQRAQLTLRAERTKSRTMRQIPISDRLLAVLRLIERDPAGNPHPPTAHVFGDAIGRKVGDPKKSWQKACKTAAIVDLRFHDLRHEAGSRLVERGWPLHHVQRMLGHQDAKTTSIYLNATIHELADSMRRFGTGGHSLHLVAREAKQEPPPLVQQDAVVASKALAS